MYYTQCKYQQCVQSNSLLPLPTEIGIDANKILLPEVKKLYIILELTKTSETLKH